MPNRCQYILICIHLRRPISSPFRRPIFRIRANHTFLWLISGLEHFAIEVIKANSALGSKIQDRDTCIVIFFLLGLKYLRAILPPGRKAWRRRLGAGLK
jgi:hypothetical protein